MLFDETFMNDKKDSKREALSLRRRISSMEVKKDRLYNLYFEDDYFSRDDLKRKLEIFDREIKGLKQLIAQKRPLSSGKWQKPQCSMMTASSFPGRSPLLSLCGKKLPL
jgi:hypothetical protein